MTTAFKILCVSQIVIGFLMFVFGLVDRTIVKFPCSFLAIPIWIGILAIIAGICGIVIGNSYQRRGFLGPNMVSGLRAINIVCVVVAYNAFSCYGTLLASLSFYDETSYVSTSVSVKKSITSVLMFLFIAEMFCGVWLALLNKEVMFLSSTPPIQHQVPVAGNYGAPLDPRQATPPTLNFSTQPEYQQQQQHQPQQHFQQFPKQ